MPSPAEAGRPPRRTLGRGPGASSGPRAPAPAPPEPHEAACGSTAVCPAPDAPVAPTAPQGPSEAALRAAADQAAGAQAARAAPSAAQRLSEAAACAAAAPNAGGRPAFGGTSAPAGTPAAAAAIGPGSPAEATRAEGGTTAGAGAAAGAPAESGACAGGGAPGGGGDGRFTLRLDNFEGPFDLLLQLISRHKLDVTEVALSKVTDEFMAHIRAMGPDWDLDQTTEFLVVAATLLDLKAARLLPAAEVEDEADLALLEARDLLFARLLQYRAYKRIADVFAERAESEGRRHPRTVGLEDHHAALLPEVVLGIGAEGFARLAAKAMQPRAEPQVYVDHIHAPLVSVREQAAVLVAALRERGAATFDELTQDTDDTLTVVARFLALLELYREKAVALEQEEALRTLTVRWTGGGAGAMPAVTDEFDRIAEAGE
ncbi:segregation/condensation protein A [Streptomyces sp. KD18]|nr:MULTISPECIES: segregation/condensation protein A [Streptomyces]MBD3580680.1 segregation/condensation protein A [Streptomyces sp. KD18]